MSGFCSKGGAAYSSARDDWETPQALFEELDSIYSFTLDAAASDENHKVNAYFTAEQDSLSQQWGGVVFCNPPYGRNVGKWVRKAHDEAAAGNATVVMLIPARTDTSYWHDYIFGKAKVRFLRGRLKFELDGVATNSAPFPSAIVVFEKGHTTMESEVD